MSAHDDDTCPHLVVLGRLEAENARLKAEVERLTKAGDAMANVLCFCLGLSGEEPRFVKDWNAAKEGKGQP